MRTQAVLGLIALSALPGLAAADTGPIGPGDPTWAIRSVLGYTKTGGNTDTRGGIEERCRLQVHRYRRHQAHRADRRGIPPVAPRDPREG
jgi:hypothetical protein